LKLEDYLQVWPGHGAGSACGKDLGAVPDTTVGYEKRYNAALDAVRKGEDAFVDTILSGQPEPPLYWARMKRDNKMGPDVIGHLPRPRKLTAAELKTVAMHTDVAVLDTRLDRTAFMAAHIPGSLFAPLNKSFNTIAGSYVPENTPIYLIVDDDRVEEAVRDLIRIGLDNIVGYANTEVLEHYFDEHGEKAVIKEITFDEIDGYRKSPDVQVVDVRGLAEWQPSRVPDSVNVAHTRMLVRMDELPRDKTLALYCGGGGRAASASALLSKNGFDVTFVNGEFELYAEKGDVEMGATEEATV
jgi:hydroxyacylglutathione hydrolase